MPTDSIKRLTATDSIVSGDSLAIDKVSAGGDRKLPYSVLITKLNSDLTFPGTNAKPEDVIQYSTPIAGGTITITDGSNDDSNMWLIITPAGTLATLTIKMPPVASVVDKQEVLVNCTQVVTTLTLDANGATDVIGEPSALTANGFFKLKYDNQTKNWYRVG